MRRILGLTAAAVLVAPAGAGAAERLSLQAQMVNGGWTVPAPGQRAAACLVDTGVDASQRDLPATLATAAIPGIASTAPASTPSGPVMHGTWMAQYVGAPADGYGMIGATPGVPIIVVRAMRDGEGTFSGGDYTAGAGWCDRTAAQRGWRVASIGLALGGDGVSTQERQEIRQLAIEATVPIFAAVGNRPGVPMFPASETGIIGVSALHTQTGDRCANDANPDLESEGVAAPGCIVTLPIGGAASTVTSAGTSGATSLMAAAVAQVCDLAPALSPRECWDVVRSTARPVAGGRVVDVRAAAAAVGVPAPPAPADTEPVFETPAGALPRTPGQISVDDPVAPGVRMPGWYESGAVPKVRWISRTKVRVSSPDRTKKARLWTSLRGAKVGRLKSTTGQPRKVRGTVRVTVTQKVGRVTFTRTWKLPLGPRPAAKKKLPRL